MRTLSLIIILAAMPLTACATSKPSQLPAIQWPPQPLESRAELAGVAYGPHDLGAVRPWYTRIWDFVAGEDVDDVFIRPFSVAVQGSRIAVGDTETGAVWLINQTSGDYERFGDIAGHPILAPVGLAFAGDSLCVSDAERGVVECISFEGKRLRGYAGLARPAGIAVSADGRLAVAQPAAHRVTVFDARGGRTDIGTQGGEPGQFNFPTQVAFAANGDLLVNDALNFRIQSFNKDLVYTASFGKRGDARGYFGRSRGMAIDDAANIYIADALFDAVQVFGAGGGLHLVIGSGGTAPGEFWLPGGVAYDAGRLVVADEYNGRIQILQLRGEEKK